MDISAEPATVYQPMNEARIGDVEREQAAKLIVAAVGSGHLNVDEADQRIARIYEARWPSDLATLLADLPGTASTYVTPPPPPHSPVPRPRSRMPLAPAILFVIAAFMVLGPILHALVLPVVLVMIGVLMLARAQLKRPANN